MTGISIPVSLSIGMDSAALFLPMLAFIGLRWVYSPKNHGPQFLRLGFILIATAVVIFGLTFAPANWLDYRCDAYSLFYVMALVNLGAALSGAALLAMVMPILQQSLKARVLFGAMLAIAATSVLLFVFPHCASGPFGNFSPELYDRWLSRIIEAKPIFEAVLFEPHLWFSNLVYSIVVLVISIAMCIRHGKRKPELLVLLAIVAICTLGILFQIRFLRTGIIAAIPFCVLFANDIWTWLKTKSFSLEFAKVAALGLICFPLTSIFWFSVGQLAFRDASGVLTSGIQVTNIDNNVVSNEKISASLKWVQSCNANSAYQDLQKLPKGMVMSDLNSASPILVHTGHNVVSGPYHRNEKAILSVMDFFETDEQTAKAISDRLRLGYVALCNEATSGSEQLDNGKLSSRIRSNQLPDWLEWVSNKNDTMLVLKVTQ